MPTVPSIFSLIYWGSGIGLRSLSVSEGLPQSHVFVWAFEMTDALSLSLANVRIIHVIPKSISPVPGEMRSLEQCDFGFVGTSCEFAQNFFGYSRNLHVSQSFISVW